MARPRGSRKQRDDEARLMTGAGRMIGYIRVSTSGQQENGHSLAGQNKALRDSADREGLTLVDVVQDVESGAKQRDNLDAAWERVKAGEAEGIMFLRLDRLGRSLAALAALVDEAEKLKASLYAVEGGWQIRRGETVNSALPVLMGVAQMERSLISRRTKEGLAAARAKGVRLGGKVENNGELSQRATELRRQGKTLQEIADTFNAEGLKTGRGGDFKPTTVYRMIGRVDPTANPVGGYRKSKPKTKRAGGDAE